MTNIMECFDKAEELLEFATEGYAILYAMELAGMDNINDIPDSFPDNKSDQNSFRDKLSAKIVDQVFEVPNTKEVINVSTDKSIKQSEYCICRLDIGGTMVYCCNSTCDHGCWFHLECLGMEEDDVPEGEWFCSDDCKKKAEAVKKKKKKTVDNFRDLRNDYVRRLLWRGLNEMARHDAVKENDGPRMIQHWKFDMFEFFEKKHPKYFIYGHRLLVNLAGATSERIKHNLIWERTVNVKGGKRRNIPKDLHCEHLNREYKENSKRSGGQLTEETVARHSQMLGIGKVINEIFEEKVVGKPSHTRKHAKVNRKPDILRMVRNLHPERLCRSEIGWSSLTAFEEFSVVRGLSEN